MLEEAVGSEKQVGAYKRRFLSVEGELLSLLVQFLGQ